MAVNANVFHLQKRNSFALRPNPQPGHAYRGCIRSQDEKRSRRGERPAAVRWGKIVPDEDSSLPIKWGMLLLNATLGVFVLFVNFPKFVSRTIDANVSWSWLNGGLHHLLNTVQDGCASVIGPFPSAFFERTMTLDFAMMWIFLALAAVFALRRASPALLLAALCGILLGYLALHVVSWLAVVIVKMIGAVLYIMHWIGVIVTAIVEFIVRILRFVFSYWIPIAIMAALIIAVVLRDQLGRLIAWAAGLAVVGYILVRVIPVLYRWIMYVLRPIIAFVLAVLKAIGQILDLILIFLTPIIRVIVFAVIAFYAFILALGVLAALGNLWVAQLLAGWHAGKGAKGMALGGFAIGSAAALIMLAGAATPDIAASMDTALAHSTAWLGFSPSVPLSAFFVSTLPDSVNTFVFAYMTHLKAPAVDAFILLAVLALADWSVARGIARVRPTAEEDVPVHFYPAEYFAIFGGLLIGVIVLFMQAIGEQD
jgi:hypothetical protein